ncbi:MAG TPA: hypothetical protein VGV86_11325 [Acidimicrobiales bacterium]|nr:hypothetical protein [Acidimicrobiales bacterium]
MVLGPGAVVVVATVGAGVGGGTVEAEVTWTWESVGLVVSAWPVADTVSSLGADPAPVAMPRKNATTAAARSRHVFHVRLPPPPFAMPPLSLAVTLPSLYDANSPESSIR